MRWFSVFVLSVLFSVQAYSQANCTVTAAPTAENPDIKVMECKESFRFSESNSLAGNGGGLVRVQQDYASKLPAFPLEMGDLTKVEVTGRFDGQSSVTFRNLDDEDSNTISLTSGRVTIGGCDIWGETVEVSGKTVVVGPEQTSSPLTVDFAKEETETLLPNFPPPHLNGSIYASEEEAPLICGVGRWNVAVEFSYDLAGAPFAVSMSADMDFDITIKYTFGPRHRDLLVRPGLRKAQTVLDFDLDGDGVPDLVAGKTTMVAARLKLVGKLEDYTPAQLNQVVDVNLEVGGVSTPWQVTSDVDFKPPTVRNILLATKNDFSRQDGLPVRFFFVPQEGDAEVKVVAKFPSGSGLQDPRPLNNERIRPVQVRRTNPLALDFVQITDCSNNPLCYGSIIDPFNVTRMKTREVELVQRLFPVPDESIEVTESVAGGIKGLYDIAPEDSPEIPEEIRKEITKGLAADIANIKLRALRSNKPTKLVGIVPNGYFQLNHRKFDAKEPTVGLHIKKDWPILVQDDQAGTGVLAHELGHNLGNLEHSDAKPLDGYYIDTKNLAASHFLDEKKVINIMEAMATTGDLSRLWITRSDYRDLWNGLSQPLPVDPKIVIVSGFIINGTSVEIDSVVISETGLPVLDEEDGDVTFRLKNTSGDILNSVRSSPPKEIVFERAGIDEEGNPGWVENKVDISAYRPFVHSFELPDEPIEITLEKDNVELISVNVSTFQFDTLIQFIRDISDQSLRAKPSRSREKLLELAMLAMDKFESGKKQASVDILNKELSKMVERLVFDPAKRELIGLIEGLVEQMLVGLETFDLRKKVLDADPNIFKIKSESSRNKILKAIDDFQRSLDKKKGCLNVFVAKTRLSIAVKKYVKKEFQGEFVEMINSIIIRVADENETAQLKKLILELPKDAFKWLGGFHTASIISQIDSAQKNIEKAKMQSALRDLKRIGEHIERFVNEIYRDEIANEIEALIAQITEEGKSGPK